MMRSSILLFLAAYFLLTASPALSQEPPFDLPPKGEVLKIRSAILETSKGKVYLELFPEEAPWHVANFKYLADKGFYKNLTFLFAHPDYLIPGGVQLPTPCGRDSRYGKTT
jgi:hypothetical protein